MGRALFPHPQWDRLDSLWESFYGRAGLDSERAAVFKAAPESGGFARECVKDQDHRDFSLSRAAFASKIAPVGARVNRIVTQARRIVRTRSSR
jgi:hypothetical protein